MDAIQELLNINFSYVFISVFVILIGIKTIVSLFEWMIDKLGLETKRMRSQKAEHKLLLQTSQNLMVLQEKHEEDMEKSDRYDEEMRKDIKKLTDMFLDKQIDDMRWEINNFATQVSEGRPCNKDSFTHCIHTWQKYEKLLAENGLENGEVEISMEIINESYRDKLKNGYFSVPTEIPGPTNKFET